MELQASPDTEHLVGMLNGLVIGVRELIRHLPDPLAVQHRVGLAIEQAHAAGLASSATSEQQLAGMDLARRLLCGPD